METTANYTEEESKAIAREYKELLRISYQTLTDEDKKVIRLAFDTAVNAHKNQRRKSGEPYIFHPIAVAKIGSTAHRIRRCVYSSSFTTRCGRRYRIYQ